jgi:hypothetical protein
VCWFWFLHLPTCMTSGCASECACQLLLPSSGPSKRSAAAALPTSANGSSYSGGWPDTAVCWELESSMHAPAAPPSSSPSDLLPGLGVAVLFGLDLLEGGTVWEQGSEDHFRLRMLNTHVLKCFHTSAVSSTSATTGVLLHFCIRQRFTRFHFALFLTWSPGAKETGY